ncbi:serine protease [Oceanobacillus sp. E9]|uniref:Serine protease inhibitor n=2 Tax=Bacillaceae TaxID=186817 RepID=A0ABQ5TRF2_9BACI|nr:serine protease [Oceanobacillus sp. E9]GLO67870.1 serine protease inhibitor [Oceanobacillus kimchii]
MKEVSEASNLLAFQSIQSLDPNDDGNVFVSPTSYWLAMAMVYNGANGDTRSEMGQALQLQGMDIEDFNHQNASLMEHFTNVNDEELELNIANSIWLNQTYEFLDTFQQSVTDTYQAELAALTTPEPINEWVSNQTNGKIKDIINQIDQEHVAILVNATYFNGAWTYPFDENNTQERTFHKKNNSSVEVPFMALNEELPYVETDQMQAVSLPYGENEDMQMELFLPKEDIAMDDFLEGFTLENWQEWRDSMEIQKGNLRMPKFSLEYEAELQNFFQSLGMEQAFDTQEADFSNMIDQEQLGALYIDKIVHKTFLDVDEEGTEAAGATSVEMKTTSIEIGENFDMEINRPFLLTISDNETDTILFMGMIHEPTSID